MTARSLTGVIGAARQHRAWRNTGSPAWRGWALYFSYGSRSQAYRAVDRYVEERVRYFLRRRHKVPSPGTRRYSAERVFGALGVFELRRFRLERPAHARV